MYFSYVPKYGDLDYIFEKYVKDKPNTKLNFFFDVKNGIYQDKMIDEHNKLEHAVEFISAVTNVMAYVKNRFSTFFDIRDRIRFYFFCETGTSLYHKAIQSTYKSNRSINDALTRTREDELFSEVTFFCIYALRDLINSLPDAYFFLGEYREYDYIPYVVYKRKFTDDDIGIVFSTDKDMYQLQTYAKNYEQLEKLTMPSKWHPGRLFINKDNYVQRLMYKEFQNELPELNANFARNHFSLLRSIVGDGGDGIDGIKGLGYKTFFKLMDKFNLYDMVLSRELYNDKLHLLDFFKYDFERDPIIFDLDKIKTMDKEMKSSKGLQTLLNHETIKTVCKNLALMDFDIMYHRRRSKEVEEWDSVLLNDKKVKTQEEANVLIQKTGLWNTHPYLKINVII